MRIRRRWLVMIVAAAAFLWWGQAYWYVPLAVWWEQIRGGRFLEQSTRSHCYVVPEDDWLDFQLPSRDSIVRITTNAALRELPPPELRPRDPRPGWRYVIEYAFLNTQGDVLDQARHHFRAGVTEYRNPETGELFTAGLFANSDLLPADTRTMQYPLHRFAEQPDRLRLRLVEKHADIEEVEVRVYCRRERPDYDKPNTWRRLSQKRRETLCRATVYSPELISSYEQRNLLRYQWSPLPPLGLEGQDYARRVLYTLDAARGAQVDTDIVPQGIPAGRDLHAVIPVPADEGRVRLECELIERLSAGIEAAKVDVLWYGKTVHRRQRHQFELRQPIESFELPVHGGLVEIQSPRAVVVRPTWKPAASALSSIIEDITPEPIYVRAYWTDAQRAVDYTISHVDALPTPFCIALRRLLTFPDGAASPASVGLSPTSVQWQFLDAHGNTVARGEIGADQSLSCYDRVETSPVPSRVTDPANYYFSVPPEVCRARIRSLGEPVLVAGFSRAPDLGKVTRVPEDYDTFSRTRVTNRSWFMLQPDDHLTLLEQDRAVSIRAQPRPPEDDPEILAGRYQWEDFRPAGLWKARYLLTPREPDTPIRHEALDVTYCELEPGCEHTVRFFDRPDRPWTEPRLIYVVDQNREVPIQVFLDGQPYHTAAPRSARGELTLPPIPAAEAGDLRSIRVESDALERVFVNGLDAPERPTFLKRLALRFSDGKLRFEYQKPTPEAELLTLRFFRTASALPTIEVGAPCATSCVRRTSLSVETTSPTDRDVRRTSAAAGQRKGSGVFFGHTSGESDESSAEKDSRPRSVAATSRAKTDRSQVRVHIRRPVPRPLGPSRSWTIARRTFQLGPAPGGSAIVLGAAGRQVDAGSVCYIPLGDDLPPDTYTIEVELASSQNDEGYVVLSKTTPGLAARREVLLQRDIQTQQPAAPDAKANGRPQR